MSKEQQTNEEQPPELTQEELAAVHAEELPQREAMSVLRVPFLTGAPVEAAEPELPDQEA